MSRIYRPRFRIGMSCTLAVTLTAGLLWTVQPALAESPPSSNSHEPTSSVQIETPDKGSVVISVIENSNRARNGQTDAPANTQESLAQASEELGSVGTWVRIQDDASKLLAGRNKTERYQQEINGLPVFHAELAVTRDGNGNITFVAGSGAAAPHQTSFTVSRSRSREIARAYVTKENAVPTNVQIKTGTPIKGWYDASVTGSGPKKTLAAIQVEVATVGFPASSMIYLDATTGKVLASIALDRHEVSRVICDWNNAVVRDWSQEPYCRSGGEDLVREEGDPATGIEQVDTVYDSFGRYEDFMKTRFNFSPTELIGWDAKDGNGKQLRATVRGCLASDEESCPYKNAFWGGSTLAGASAGGGMFFGDGYGTLGITGHEVTHGLIDATARLVYQSQSGAINESIADVFGTLVEKNGNASINPKWELTLNGKVVRSMSNPKLTGDPDRYGGQYWYSGSQDSGGVHTNSGVGNKLAYLIAEGGTAYGTKVRGIGLEKTAGLMLATLTMLPQTARYATYGRAMVQSCENAEEEGAVTNEDCAQVRNALKAVGILTVEPFIYSDKTVVRSGQSAKLSLQVRELNGALANGVPVELYQRTVGGRWSKIKSSVTDYSDGHLNSTVTITKPTQFRFKGKNDWPHISWSNTVTIRVTSKVKKQKFQVARQKRKGAVVTSRVKLQDAGNRIAWLQRYESKRSRWVTVKKRNIKNAQFTIKWRAPRSLKSSRFRVLLPENNGWAQIATKKSQRLSLQR